MGSFCCAKCGVRSNSLLCEECDASKEKSSVSMCFDHEAALNCRSKDKKNRRVIANTGCTYSFKVKTNNE